MYEHCLPENLHISGNINIMETHHLHTNVYILAKRTVKRRGSACRDHCRYLQVMWCGLYFVCSKKFVDIFCSFVKFANFLPSFLSPLCVSVLDTASNNTKPIPFMHTHHHDDMRTTKILMTNLTKQVFSVPFFLLIWAKFPFTCKRTIFM